MYYNNLFMFAPVLLMAWQAGDVAAALQFQGKYFESTSALTHALWYITATWGSINSWRFFDGISTVFE